MAYFNFFSSVRSSFSVLTFHLLACVVFIDAGNCIIMTWKENKNIRCRFSISLWEQFAFGQLNGMTAVATMFVTGVFLFHQSDFAVTFFRSASIFVSFSRCAKYHWWLLSSRHCYLFMDFIESIYVFTISHSVSHWIIFFVFDWWTLSQWISGKVESDDC